MSTPSTRLRTTQKLTFDEACERIDKRFSHVKDNTLMSLIKTWVKEILKETGC